MREKELLSIVEDLKVFGGVIRFIDLAVQTDILNMIRWRTMVEEYHPKFVHVKVLNNDATDASSRLHMQDKNVNTVDWEKRTKD